MRAKSAVFHVIILGAIIGASALGMWQLHRREWKHEIMAEMGDRLAMPPMALTERVGNDFHWRYAKVTGTIDYDHVITIPRYAQGMTCAANNQHGLIVIAPLRLASGDQVLLRLGWFPGDTFQKTGTEKITTTGVIRPFSTSWLPAYDLVSHAWFRPSVEMYDALKLPYLNYYVDNAISAQNCHFPQSVWAQPELFDSHLQYAVTWFTLAGVLLTLYIYRQWTIQKNHPPKI